MGKGLSDRAAVAAIVVLSLVAYGRGLVPGWIRTPAEILEGFAPWRAPEGPTRTTDPILADLVSQGHPWLIHAAREVRQGRLPLWNPYTYCGSPFVGAMQTAVFSPFTALAYVLPIGFAIGLASVLAPALAGLSMYWYLRLLAVSPAAGLLGAVSFMFCGFMAAWLGWSLAFTAAWLPAVFAGLELVRREGSWRSAVPLALATAGLVLGGHPETAFHAGAAAGAYALAIARGGGSPFLLRVAAGFGAGLLLASVQVVPFLEYLPHTQTFRCRSGGGVLSVLPFKGVLLFLVPRYFGYAGAGTAWDGEFSPNYTEVSGTVGLVPILLLPAAVAAFRRSRAPFFLVLAAVSFACVYRIPGLPLGALLLEVPGFSVSVNHRLVLLLAFALSALGAFGMERLMRADGSPRMGWATACWAGLLVIVLAANLVADRSAIEAARAWSWVAPRVMLAAALLTAAALAALRAGRLASAGIAFLLAVEAVSVLPFAAGYCPVVHAGRFYPVTPAIRFLSEHAGNARIVMPLVNLPLVHALREPGGYDAMNPAAVTDLLGLRRDAGTPCNSLAQWSGPWDSPVLRLFGVRFVLVPPGAKPKGGGARLVYDGPDARIFELPRALPRAFLVSRAVRFASREDELAAITGGRIDPARMVTLAGETGVEAGAGGENGSARIVTDEPGRVVVRTSSAGKRFLVLTDSWYPGWRATVDGREAGILRADYAFRAVEVPAGDHEVVFRYAPASFRIGAALSLLGLLAVALAWFGPRRDPGGPWYR